MAEAGIPVEDWRRLGPYWDTDDLVYKILLDEGLITADITAELERSRVPLPQKYKDLDEWRDAVVSEFKKRGAKTQQAKAELDKLEEFIGLSWRVTNAQKQVVSRDPRIVGALQRQYDRGDLSFPPSKALIDFAEELLMGSSR